MQEADAEKRIEILRGNSSVSPKVLEPLPEQEARPPRRERERKRKRAGEDDTDRDIRLARESVTFSSQPALEKISSQHRSSKDAPLTDRNGHINLFPEEHSRPHVAKNPEAEAEVARKKREYEDQYTMRFSNAAGFKQGLNDPWYFSLKENGTKKQDEIGTDVWGNEDHGRKERDRLKRESDDPLASMRRGVQELKAVEKERKVWMETKEQEMCDLKRMERKGHRRSLKWHRHGRDEDELDGFGLDDPLPPRLKERSRNDDEADTSQRRKHRHRHHHHRRNSSDDKPDARPRNEYHRKRDHLG